MTSDQGGTRPPSPPDKKTAVPKAPALSGRKPGDRRVRVDRSRSEYFRYTPSGALEARPKAHQELQARGRVLAAARRVLLVRRPDTVVAEVPFGGSNGHGQPEPAGEPGDETAVASRLRRRSGWRR